LAGEEDLGRYIYIIFRIVMKGRKEAGNFKKFIIWFLVGLLIGIVLTIL